MSSGHRFGVEHNMIARVAADDEPVHGGLRVDEVGEVENFASAHDQEAGDALLKAACAFAGDCEGAA